MAHDTGKYFYIFLTNLSYPWWWSKLCFSTHQHVCPENWWALSLDVIPLKLQLLSTEDKSPNITEMDNLVYYESGRKPLKCFNSIGSHKILSRCYQCLILTFNCLSLKEVWVKSSGGCQLATRSALPSNWSWLLEHQHHPPGRLLTPVSKKANSNESTECINLIFFTQYSLLKELPAVKFSDQYTKYFCHKLHRKIHLDLDS